MLMLLLGCKQSSDKPLIIAAASSVQYVAKDLIKAFQEESDVQCELVLSSSGKLAAQIHNGAPYDVFLSADQYYPSFLNDHGLTSSPPVLYASGRLILWSSKYQIDSLNLQDPRFRKIAIANPEVAPYGRAAKEVLGALQLDKQLEKHLVYGENISQVNQFIDLGAADVGMTGQAIAIHKAQKGFWLYVPDSLYQPILQNAVLLKGGQAEKSKGEEFIQYLTSQKGRKVLKAYGY